MRRIGLLVVAGLAANLLSGWHTDAQTVRGRFSSTLYGLERVPGEQGTVQHLRAYQTLNLTVSRLAGPRLSIQVYGLVNTDLRGNGVDDPRVWLYNAYLRYAFGKGEVRLGRQRVFAGVGFGTIDGLRLKTSWLPAVDADVFAGTQMPLTEGVNVDSWSDSHMFGVRLGSTRWERTRLAVSFVQKSRARKVYLAPGEFTANRWLLEKISALQQRRIGLDVWQGFGTLASASARLDYDLLQRQVHRAEVNGRANFGKLQLGMDYIFRNPLVDGNSIFSVFSQNSNHEIALRGIYSFSPSLGLFARVATIAFEEESTLRVSLGLRAQGGMVGLAHQSGYGGNRWGVVGDYRWRITRRLWLHLGSNYNTYRYYGLDGDWEHTLAGIAGATIYPMRQLRVDLELHGLQNRHVDSDLRFLLRAVYGVRL